MPVTIDTSAVATDDPLAADLRIAMDEKVANQDVDTSQFATMLMRMPVEQASSLKEEWIKAAGRFLGCPVLCPFAA